MGKIVSADIFMLDLRMLFLKAGDRYFDLLLPHNFLPKPDNDIRIFSIPPKACQRNFLPILFHLLKSRMKSLHLFSHVLSLFATLCSDQEGKLSRDRIISRRVLKP
jgi:hypothetical protein